ncbi:hypothetical protein EDB83DRAFT_2504390 [Lactarius deliciosus]|nr:hypothetical protein EDB83DRAFT_2504390 [Lactarius deliciosus]
MSESPSSLKRKRAPSPQPIEDTPVLSHAAKRKQKRALLNESTSTAVSKKQKKEEDDSTPVKRQNSIWVGNLSYKTTQESLRRFFDGSRRDNESAFTHQAGESTPRRISKSRKQRVRFSLWPLPSVTYLRLTSRSFAYVDFATLEAKNAAIVMTESPLDGRRLLIKDWCATTLTVAPQTPGRPVMGQVAHQSPFARKILSMQKQPPAATVFFGNLGFNTTVDSIRGLLEAHRAQPKNAPDPTGRCRWFAFVDFTSTEHATAALVHPKNHHLDGRKLVVEYASADAVRRGGGAGSRPNKTKGRPETTTPSSVPRDDDKSMDSGRRSSASSKVDRGTRKARPAPGAALALAKREQVAIVPSQGRRIIFDD